MILAPCRAKYKAPPMNRQRVDVDVSSNGSPPPSGVLAALFNDENVRDTLKDQVASTNSEYASLFTRRVFRRRG